MRSPSTTRLLVALVTMLAVSILATPLGGETQSLLRPDQIIGQ